jgi:hypothetical protein
MNIALSVRKPDEKAKVADPIVPAESVACPECGAWHIYNSEDSLDFDGPEDLLRPRNQ